MRRLTAAATLIAAVLFSGCGKPLVWNTGEWQKLFLKSFRDSLPFDLEIDRFSWSWQSRPQIVLDQPVFLSRQNKSPILKASKIRASLSLRALAAGRLLLFSWSFERPVIFLSKNSEGKWNWPGMPDAASSGGFEFSAGTLELTDAEIRVEDSSEQPVSNISLTISSAQMRRPAQDSPYRGHAVLKFPFKPQAPFLTAFTYAPDADRLTYDLTSADKNLEMHGEVLEMSSDFFVQFKANVHGQDLGLVLPESAGIQGKLTAQYEGGTHGTHPAQLKRFLAAEGALDVRQGRFTARNFVRDVLEALKPVASVQPLLKGDYKGLLKPGSTPFEILQMSSAVQRDQLLIDHLQLKQADYIVEGEGKIGIQDGLVDFRARLVCMEPFSAWLTGQSPEFKSFENPQKRVVVPFLYRGLLPDIAAEADWDQLKTAEVKK